MLFTEIENYFLYDGCQGFILICNLLLLQSKHFKIKGEKNTSKSYGNSDSVSIYLALGRKTSILCHRYLPQGQMYVSGDSPVCHFTVGCFPSLIDSLAPVWLYSANTC